MKSILKSVSGLFKQQLLIYIFMSFLFIFPIPPPTPRVKSDGKLSFKIPRPKSYCPPVWRDDTLIALLITPKIPQPYMSIVLPAEPQGGDHPASRVLTNHHPIEPGRPQQQHLQLRLWFSRWALYHLGHTLIQLYVELCIFSCDSSSICDNACNVVVVVVVSLFCQKCVNEFLSSKWVSWEV